MENFEKARALLREFKGDAYLFGAGVLPHAGGVVAALGTRAALVRTTFPGSDDYVTLLAPVSYTHLTLPTKRIV